MVKGIYYNVIADASRRIEGTVEFSKGVFEIIDTIHIAIKEIDDIEIIGNIYDNPELLEEE